MSRSVALFFFLSIYFQGISSYSQTNKIDTLAANKYFNLAKELATGGAVDSSKFYMLKSANAYKSAEQWDRFFDAIYQVAYLNNYQHRFKETIHFLDSIDHEFLGHFNGKFKSAILYLGIHAGTNLELNNYIEADKWLKEAANLLDSNPHTIPGNYLWTYYQQSVIYSRLGLNDLSLKHLDKTEWAARKYQDSSYMGQIYNLKGIINRRLGEYEKALEYYSLGYNLQRQSQPKVYLTSFNVNFGVLFHHLGQDSIALSYLQEGLDLLEGYTSNYYPVESVLRNTKANIFIDLGKNDSAEIILEKNLEREYSHYNEYGFGSAETYSNLGLLENRKGDYTTADQYYTQTKNIVLEKLGPKSPKLAKLYRNIADNLVDQGQYDAALVGYQDAIKLVAPEFDITTSKGNPLFDGNIVDRLEFLNILKSKANALQQRYLVTASEQDLSAALETDLLAINLFNQIRDNLYYGDSKQVLSGLMKPLFEQSIELAMTAIDVLDNDQGNLNSILSAMEGSKSYILSSALQQSLVAGESILPDSVASLQDNLTIQVENLKLERNNLMAKATIDSLELADNAQSLLQAHEEYEFFKSKLNRDYPQYNETRYSQNKLTVDELISSLSNDEILIEYFSGANNLYALAATSSTCKVFNLGEYQALEDRIREFSNFSPGMDPNIYQNNAYSLYQDLLAPILIGAEKKNIILIPDGALGYLPFDALVDSKQIQPSFEDLNYLVNKHAITEHYLASLYLKNSNTNMAEGSFIGYAPDFSGEQLALLTSRSSNNAGLATQLSELPFAKSEVENISSLLDGEAIIGTLASEANFKANAGAFNYLHIASHTLLNTSNPLFSMLVFAKDDNDTIQDGFLHAYELYSLELKNQLVTLSACNTGVGEYKNGEGIISLARGFIYAGASGVLMSLWEVADRSTAEIMEYFYTEIENGTSKHKALRNAKLTYLKKADNITANPYYWAGFTYLGSQERQSYMFYWPIATIFIVLAAVFARRRRKRLV